MVDSARESIALGWNLTDVGLDLATQAINTLLDVEKAQMDFTQKFNDSLETCTIFNEVTGEFSSYDNTLLDEAEDAQDLLLGMQTELTRSDDFLNNIDWLFPVASFFAIILACLCIAVVVALFLDLPQRVRHWSYRFFLGSFVFLVSFAFIFAIAFIITSTAMSDACVGNPNVRLKNILQQKYNDLPPFRKALALYVIDGTYMRYDAMRCGRSNQVRSMGLSWLRTT